MPFPRKIAAVRLGLAFAVLLGACGHKGSSSATASGSHSSSTTASTTPGQGGGTTTTVKTGAGSSGGGNGSTPGSGGTSTGGGAPTALPATQAPAKGKYIYDQSTSEDGGAPPSQAGFFFDDLTGSSGDRRQTLTIVTQAGNQVRHLAWRTNSELVLDEHAQNKKAAGPTCDWNPDYRELALPLTIGLTWTSDSSCTSSSGTQHQRLSARVVRYERTQVGSDTVDVAVIERTVTSDSSSSIAGVSQERRSTDLFAPKYGLVVRSTGTATTRVPGQADRTTSFGSVLRSVHPG